MTNSQTGQTRQMMDFFFKFIVFALFLLVINTWISSVFPSWGKTPGESRDDVFYDSIAYNLAQDRGFSIDFSNPEWLEAYSETDPNAAWIYNVEVTGPTTSRAPAFPYTVSWIYRVFGRDFDMVRVVNMVVLAFGLSWLVCCVQSYYGYAAAITSFLLMSADFAIMTSAGQIVTEPLGTALMSITFSLAIWAWNSEKGATVPPWRWAIVGLFFALTLLVRSTLVAWLMQIGVLLILAAIYLLVRRRNPMRLIQGGFLFLVVAVLTCVPWWTRNCQVSGVFTPFGSAGSIGFVGGFSDEAVQDNGNWNLDAVTNRQARTMRERQMRQLTLAEQEYVMGEDSRTEGIAWIKDNMDQMPKLTSMKVLNHLAIIGHPNPVIPILNGLVLFGALIGIYGTWRRFGFWIALVTFMSIATTMATWSHHGRFAIPIRPLWHVGCALGVLYFWWPKFRKEQAEL